MNANDRIPARRPNSDAVPAEPTRGPCAGLWRIVVGGTVAGIARSVCAWAVRQLHDCV
ncbi:hypothetical protein [Streptomyces sp. SID3343]|uniref:hypothetical protein n=1 Tax=Streptomyces sp. SID3343 TaxID=2690260 RepID=UPI00136E286F|nr:hypothetical protein [Streptomyces sp. SID3343]MYV97646.1 hypothetical protein [Streptomyces sp. SID3343]